MSADRVAASGSSPTGAVPREILEAAHCIESFSVMVHGATNAKGERAVILAVIPPGERGWTFPLPVAEARRIASLLVDVADLSDRKESPRG